jgi:hypothetical protein
MIDVEQILELVIPPVGTITILNLGDKPKIRGLAGSEFINFVFVPNPKDSNARSHLSSIEGTGYDWRPERLKQFQLHYNQMFMFAPSSYHSKNQLEEAITKRFHIKELKLNPSIVQELFAAEYCGKSVLVKDQPKREAVTQQRDDKPTSDNSDESTFYGRCRYLWKNNHQKFNEWERKFVLDIGIKLKANPNTRFSPKQTECLNKLFKKYKVGYKDVASSWF